MVLHDFSYTLHHILLLKLFQAFAFPRLRTAHNLLFLATAESGRLRPAFFYDYLKTRTGAYSFDIQSVIDDLRRGGLLGSGHTLSDKGREFYSQVNFLLRYEKFTEHCLAIARRYDGDLWRIDHEVFFHPYYRSARIGSRIEMRNGVRS